MKKLKYLITLIFIFFFFTMNVSADETVNRVINIVYDDSSSMIYDYKDREYVDYWAKAKFSLELLCSSLDETDTVNIYPMSDYSDLNTGILSIDEYNDDMKPILSLDGSMTAEERVNAIDHMVTEALDTPFYAVGKAFYDLSKTTADEKWLVVLTDGEFDEVFSDSQLSEQFYNFKAYDDDVKIMYIGMDSAVFRIDEDPENDIYTEYADNPEEILDDFTRVSYRIFNRNEIEVSSGNRIKFDVPMEKLVIFAKGTDVKINSIVHPAGETFTPSSTVTIPVSDISATNYADNNKVVYDETLTGVVAVFEYQINEGNYRIDVENADDIEVFYYPSVGVTVNLIDSNGRDVYGQEEINSGTYTVRYEFINTVTGEKLSNTDLLGEIEFTTSLVRDGEIISENIEDGAEITLEPGLDSLTVEANYLTYNSVEAKFEFNVVDHHPMLYQITEMPQYEITMTGIENIDQPIVVSMELSDTELTDALWNSIPVPTVISLDTTGEGLFYEVERSDEIGIYNIYIDEGKSNFDPAGINLFIMSGEYVADQIYYSGQLNVSVNLIDGVPQIVRTIYNYRYLLIIGLLVLIILLIMMRKVMPKVIYFQVKKVMIDGIRSNEDVEMKYDRSARELTVKLHSVYDKVEYVKFKLKPTEPRIIAMIANPDKVLITKIVTSDLVTDITIDGEAYIKTGDYWVHSKNQEKPKPINGASNNVIIKITNGVEVKIYGSIQRF